MIEGPCVFMSIGVKESLVSKIKIHQIIVLFSITISTYKGWQSAQFA